MWANKAMQKLFRRNFRREWARFFGNSRASSIQVPSLSRVLPSSRRGPMFAWIAGSAGLLTLAGISLALLRRRQEMKTLPTADDVDLGRYSGVWYEIARIPYREEKRAVNIRATYTLRPDGRVDVLNECDLDGFNGPHREVHGVARLVDPAHPGRLKVRFFGLFEGDYWILELGEHYEYAAVGDPARKHLWILARKPQLKRQVFEGIVERMRAKGFDVDKLILAPQEIHSPVRTR